MAAPKNAMEIFQLTDKSNCGECGDKTCLAFAGSVFKGLKALGECPKLSSEVVERYSQGRDGARGMEENRDEYLEKFKSRAASLDLKEAAEKTGGKFADGKLTLKVLGKDFSIDTSGKLSADIHVNPWVAMPFLTYLVEGKGESPTGNWVSFRELSEGKERYPLFQKRCEEPMKAVADVYTDLFDDMVHIFSGKKVPEEFESDISVVLHPLPKVPLMVCYWLPEDGLESSLNLFFDETADKNLDNGSLFALGAGLAQMFSKLAQRHGYVVPDGG